MGIDGGFRRRRLLHTAHQTRVRQKNTHPDDGRQGDTQPDDGRHENPQRHGGRQRNTPSDDGRHNTPKTRSRSPEYKNTPPTLILEISHCLRGPVLLSSPIYLPGALGMLRCFTDLFAGFTGLELKNVAKTKIKIISDGWWCHTS